MAARGSGDRDTLAWMQRFTYVTRLVFALQFIVFPVIGYILGNMIGTAAP